MKDSLLTGVKSLCADGHSMVYWGGIGATCRRCGRVEIDGEFYGYDKPDGVSDMNIQCAACHHEVNQHRASPDGPECPCTVHDCGCVDFVMPSPTTESPQFGQPLQHHPITQGQAAPQYPAAHDQQRMNETSATGYQHEPGTFGGELDEYSPGAQVPCKPTPEPALPDIITDEPSEGTAGLPAKTNVSGLSRTLQSGATVFVGKVSDDGGAYLEFKSVDGQRTPLRLSSDAIASVVSMWTELTWGAP